MSLSNNSGDSLNLYGKYLRERNRAAKLEKEVERLRRENEKLIEATEEVIGECGLNGSIERLEDALAKVREEK